MRDAEFLGGKTSAKLDVCETLKVPPQSLGIDSRTEMSWGDFKRFTNTPRGRQQLFDHFADAEGNVRFSVKGRGDGKLKMRPIVTGKQIGRAHV